MSCLLLDPARPGQLEWAADLLAREQPVAVPTETVYGLAGRLSSELSLSRIFALKARPQFDPLIVHVLDASAVEPFVTAVTPLHRQLMEAFWPGPLTLLFEKNPARVMDLCTAGSPKVALRSPSHSVFRRLLELVQEPLAAPSANRFGRISPTSALDAIRELGPHGLEAAIDGGDCEHGIESTILNVTSQKRIELLRPGSLSLEKIRATVGADVEIVVESSSASATHLHPEAPGLLQSHYAPRTRAYFVEAPESEMPPAQGLARHALLLPYAAAKYSQAVRERWLGREWGRVEVLSARSSDIEAAAALFRTLRALDQGHFEGIYALSAANDGLGLAINDRLKRAAGKG